MDLKVHINNIHGSQMAAKITGKFTLDENNFPNLGYDVEEVITLLQKNLLQGDLTLPEGLKKESFVDD
jgi:hypothetical protein